MDFDLCGCFDLRYVIYHVEIQVRRIYYSGLTGLPRCFNLILSTRQCFPSVQGIFSNSESMDNQFALASQVFDDRFLWHGRYCFSSLYSTVWFSTYQCVFLASCSHYQSSCIPDQPSNFSCQSESTMLLVHSIYRQITQLFTSQTKLHNVSYIKCIICQVSYVDTAALNQLKAPYLQSLLSTYLNVIALLAVPSDSKIYNYDNEGMPKFSLLLLIDFHYKF